VFRDAYNPGGLSKRAHLSPLNLGDRADQVTIAAFVRAVSLALVQAGTLRDMLGACAQAMTDHLAVTFARIWTLDEHDEELLVLQASAGLYTQIDGPYSRIRVGEQIIGRIARDRQPYLSNTLGVDRPTSNHPEWPERETMAAVAGYPLIVEGRLMGVMAMFGRQPLGDAMLDALGLMALGIASGIHRKRADAAVAMLAAIVESSDEAIISSSLDGTITSFNRSAEQLFGYTAKEAIGQPVSILYPPNRVDPVASKRPDVIEGRHIPATEVTRRRKDGSLVTVSLTVSPIKDARGVTVGVSGISRDVSERRQVEAQLRQAQKMEAVGRLAGGVAHDFNNLLTIINGNTDVLIRLLQHDRRAIEMLRDIHQAGERAAGLTQQLLAYSRKQMLQPEVLDLNAVVAEARPMLARLIGEDIEITVVPDPALRRVKADAGQLGQVLMNLCVNARDAMPTGGTIVIRTSNIVMNGSEWPEVSDPPRGPYVELSVTDTGTGMDAETQKHLFEPFFTTKERGKGTGLGLATVYGIVKQSGGFIRAETAKGVGTTFRVYLPAVDARVESRTQDALAAPRGRETVLIVEDEPRVRSLMRLMLQRAGYTVLEAEDGVQAVELAAAHGPDLDLLVTDVVMPRMSGPQVADALRAARPGLSVIFISGYTGDAMLRHGVGEPTTPFLQKPFTMTDLTRKVRQVLDQRAATV
jgi:two-component system cell cycle sensor histidine kinase/response regulator CckA